MAQRTPCNHDFDRHRYRRSFTCRNHIEKCMVHWRWFYTTAFGTCMEKQYNDGVCGRQCIRRKGKSGKTMTWISFLSWARGKEILYIVPHAGGFWNWFSEYRSWFSYFFDKIIVCTDAVTLKIFQSLKSFKVRRLKNLLLIFYRYFIIRYRPF